MYKRQRQLLLKLSFKNGKCFNSVGSAGLIFACLFLHAFFRVSLCSFVATLVASTNAIDCVERLCFCYFTEHITTAKSGERLEFELYYQSF